MTQFRSLSRSLLRNAGDFDLEHTEGAYAGVSLAHKSVEN